MPGTITAQLLFNIVNGAFRDDANIQPITAAQTTIGGGNPGTVLIPSASEVDVNFGAVAPGYVIIENLDDTNWVKIGPKVAGVMEGFGIISAGRFAIMEKLPAAVWRAQANGADVSLRIRGYNP
jgi:hypothetical protein